MSKIINAFYGTFNVYVDVTAIIQNKIRVGRHIINVNNTTMGADPAPGQEKQLMITYSNYRTDIVPENSNYIWIDDDNQFKSLGFIICRCVKNLAHSFLWVECYRCIRKYYDNKIIIIDDNSNQNLIKNIPLVNTTIIKSEFYGSGEILPYYYFYHLKPFDQAVILHDNMFINKKINFGLKSGIKFLWHFNGLQYSNNSREMELIRCLKNNNNLLKLYSSGRWAGCFGAACVINYNFLNTLIRKYDLFRLIPHIRTRDDRMAFERIIGLLATAENQLLGDNGSFFGSIFNHPLNFSLTYNLYKSSNLYSNNYMTKVWSGR